MNFPHPQHPGYTLEDWKQWDGRWELIHGMAYDMTPSPSTKHQEVSGRLAFAIESALREGNPPGLRRNRQRDGNGVPDESNRLRMRTES